VGFVRALFWAVELQGNSRQQTSKTSCDLRGNWKGRKKVKGPLKNDSKKGSPHGRGLSSNTLRSLFAGGKLGGETIKGQGRSGGGGHGRVRKELGERVKQAATGKARGKSKTAAVKGGKRLGIGASVRPQIDQEKKGAGSRGDREHGPTIKKTGRRERSGSPASKRFGGRGGGERKV